MMDHKSYASMGFRPRRDRRQPDILTIMTMDAMRSLAASILLFTAAAPLARADTHEIDGTYQYQTIGGNGAEALTYRMTLGNGRIEFKNPANDRDPLNQSMPAIVEEGAAADFAAAIGDRPHPHLDFYRTRLDLQAQGRLSDVTIVKKTDDAGLTVALYFYVVYNGRPAAIISNAVPVKA